MTIALTAPTGNVGRKLAARLLDAGAEVTLLARDPEKVRPLVERGARVEVGSLEDAAFVEQATRGSEALFWVIPPNPAARDFRAWQGGIAEVAARAVERNRIAKVVTLSSVGADLREGTGPVAGLGELERRLDQTGAATSHLRAGYFFENSFLSIATIQQLGKIFLPVAGTVRLPMVATRDIAEAAARVLLDRSGGGQRVVGVHGPEELTFAEAAAAIGEGIGRPIEHVEVSPEQARGALNELGVGGPMADLYLELYASFARRQPYALEPRDRELGGETRLVAFARETLAPVVAAAATPAA